MPIDSDPVNDVPIIVEEPVKIPSETALEMAKGLLCTINSLVNNLPEFELRVARWYLENTVERADLLIAGFDGLPPCGNPLPKPTSDGPGATSATEFPAIQNAADEQPGIILSVRPNINRPDYTGHPAFIRPGMPST